MKKILVPMRASAEERSDLPPVLSVRISYLEKLFAHGARPLLVYPGVPDGILEDSYAESGGLLLTGGEDVDPALFGEDPHPQTRSLPFGRDTLEINLVRRCVADRKPVFGICRGCQVMAVAAGGSLVQHVPDHHSGEVHGTAGAAFLADIPWHDVRLTAGSLVRRVIGTDVVSVNSRHHQAVRDPGADFVVSGESPAGVVEFTEHRDSSYFCVGVQCHPELFDAELDALFAAFVAACRAP